MIGVVMLLVVPMLMAIAVTAEAGAALVPAWQPTLTDAKQLERRITLPKGAYPLASYERYYTGFIRGDRRIIRGYLYRGDNPGIYLKPSEIWIADGGCSVVEVEFDVASQRTEAAHCNGVA